MIFILSVHFLVHLTFLRQFFFLIQLKNRTTVFISVTEHEQD